MPQIFFWLLLHGELISATTKISFLSPNCHLACWRQVELSYLKGEKEFLATSWRGSLRGL